MRTDNLIRTLAADQVPPRPWSVRTVASMLALGWILSAVLFALTLAPRPDLASVIGEWRFLLKFAVALTLAASALVLAARLARPGAATLGASLAILAAPVLLAGACLVDVASGDPEQWTARLVGTNARVCLISIPLLSIPLLAAALLALRSGAPTRPRLAGAVAGVLAGGLAAALYASHCTDDSPLFVATWYSLAIGLMALVGAVTGARVLRW